MTNKVNSVFTCQTLGLVPTLEKMNKEGYHLVVLIPGTESNAWLHTLIGEKEIEAYNPSRDRMRRSSM